MPQVDLDQDIIDHLESEVRGFGETPSTVLRRLLRLEAVPSSKPRSGDQPPEPESPREPPVRPPMPALEPPISRPEISVNPKHAFLQAHEVAGARKAIDRFMLILQKLYHWSPERFAAVGRVRGQRRVYFSRSEAEVASSGQSVKPKRITGTPYFVATNLSNEKKVTIMREVLTELRVPFPKQTELVNLLDTDNMIRQPIELPGGGSDAAVDDSPDDNQI